MKKFVLFILAIIIWAPALSSFARTKALNNAKPTTAMVAKQFQNAVMHAQIMLRSNMSVPLQMNNCDQTESLSRTNRNAILSSNAGDSVGPTWWDRQTVNSMPKRNVNFGSGSGSMSAVAAIDANYATLGDYFATSADGIRYQALGQNGKNGWKSITGASQLFYNAMAQLADGTEIIIGQDPNATAAFTCLRDTGGATAGQWEATTVTGSAGGVLPSVAVSDSDFIQLIYSTNTSPYYLLKQVSRDTGKTWSMPPDTLAPFVSPGAYAISAIGNNVGIAFNYLGNIETLISYDNGEDGTYKLQAFAFLNHTTTYPAFKHGDSTSYFSDTTATFGNHLNVLMDAKGKLHVVTHIFASYYDSLFVNSTYQGLFLSTSGFYLNDTLGGVLYFETDTNPQTNFAIKFFGPAQGDPNNAFTQAEFQTGGYSYLDETDAMVAWPQLGYNSSNNTLYCVYATYMLSDYDPLVSGGKTYSIMYSHLFGTTSTDPMNTWTTPATLSQFGVNAQYPSLAENVDDHIVLEYQVNYVPCNTVDFTTQPWPPAAPSAIYAYSSPVSVMKEGINPVYENRTTSSSFTLEQNYPNPVQGTTLFQYSLDQFSNVTLKIYDMLGRQIATLTNGGQAQGLHTASFDASNLPSGVYTYTLTANGKTATNSMLVAH